MALTHDECLAYFEKLRWSGSPVCPYCGSKKSIPMHREKRYHCGYCYTSYSVTVNTLFHRSHVNLSKWFKAIFLIDKANGKVSIRQLASIISVSNKTASSMLKRINSERQKNPDLVKKIADFYAKKQAEN